MNLFEQTPDQSINSDYRPLADIVRPQNIDQVIGQSAILGPDKILTRLLAGEKLPSIIFWGPPGSGKTTLARLIAHYRHSYFVEFSAVTSGIADIKKVVEEAKVRRQLYQTATIIFVDEIHRFNKAQQDAFLPHVESGIFTLIGATTENPSFSIISALLSRSRILVLQPLTIEELIKVVDRAINYYASINQPITITQPAKLALARLADGDARRLLTALETTIAITLSKHGQQHITPEAIQKSTQKKHLLYDRMGEEHYNVISALHKSMRDSDPDGTVYWLARMLEAGEEPLFIARRLIRAAAEDIGLADPQALVIAQSAHTASQNIGMPEASVILAEAAIYIALAPKSNAVYAAYNLAQQDIENSANEPVPLHIRNAPTSFMKSIGYGKGYQYAHDNPEAKVEQQHLPDSLRDHVYYHPTNRGFERQFTSSHGVKKPKKL